MDLYLYLLALDNSPVVDNGRENREHSGKLIIFCFVNYVENSPLNPLMVKRYH